MPTYQPFANRRRSVNGQDDIGVRSRRKAASAGTGPALGEARHA